MPRTPEDTQTGDSRGFFQRWSERKAKEGRGDGTNGTDEVATASEQHQPVGEGDAGGPEADQPVISEADLEDLDYGSDFTKFMGEGVPDAIRRRALRTLWRSDPVLANVDGLCDYDDDYTDAALAVKVLQTAHRVGQGYLSDDELDANRARGGDARGEDGTAGTGEMARAEADEAPALDDGQGGDGAETCDGVPGEREGRQSVRETRMSANDEDDDVGDGDGGLI